MFNNQNIFQLQMLIMMMMVMEKSKSVFKSNRQLHKNVGNAQIFINIIHTEPPTESGQHFCIIVEMT